MKLSDKKIIIEVYLKDTDKTVLEIAEEVDLPTWEVKSTIDNFLLNASLTEELYLVPSFQYLGDFYLFNSAQEKRVHIIDNKINNPWEFTKFELLWMKETKNLSVE